MSVCAILLSYKRPQNIGRMIDVLLQVPRIAQIIVSNNHPDVDLQAWLTPLQLKQVTLLQQTEHGLCAKRFEIAQHLSGFDAFYCQDDDLFFSPAQVDALLTQQALQPHRPHGMYGQLIHASPHVFLQSGITQVNQEVDILNRVYLFTPQHVQRMYDLLPVLGFSAWGQLRHLDDVLLSFSGQGRPLCHDIGVFEDCPTSHAPNIATFLEQGFDDARIRAVQRLADALRRGGQGAQL